MGLYEDNMTICTYQQVSRTFGFESKWYGRLYNGIVCEHNFAREFSELYGQKLRDHENVPLEQDVCSSRRESQLCAM